MFFFSILGICVGKTYISTRPWAQWCESNGRVNLFMILAVSLSVFFLVVVGVLFYSLYCVHLKPCLLLLDASLASTLLPLTGFKCQQGRDNTTSQDACPPVCAPLTHRHFYGEPVSLYILHSAVNYSVLARMPTTQTMFRSSLCCTVLVQMYF